MDVVLLGSGSKGNCTYIRSSNNKTAILIDAGLSYKQYACRLSDRGISNVNSIDGILITHEHSDHVNGLGVMLGKIKTKVFLTKGTYRGFNIRYKDMIGNTEIDYINILDTFIIGDFKITAIPLYHDAFETVGYIIEEDDKKIVYITDTGYVNNNLFDLIRNADLYVIEGNHDPGMLMDSSRTIELKRRVIGNKGHLCNEDSAALFCYVKGSRSKSLVFAHISQECNSIDILENTVKRVFEDFKVNFDDYDICYALQDEPTKVFKI